MEQFICSKCNFKTIKKNNYERHLLTKKHCKNQNDCPCGKNYETRAGLWKHSQQCILPLLNSQTELIQTLLQKQDQVHEQVNELRKKMASPSIHISIFLNETCKEAINWDEFIQQLVLTDTRTVLDTVREQLDELGLKRPIHVLPTQMLYIKQQNQWNHDKPSIQTAITILNDKVQKKQRHTLLQWEREHPTWYLNEKETDIYTKQSQDNKVDESMLMVIIPKMSQKID